jgi:HD superfamily phosphodiesterase
MSTLATMYQILSTPVIDPARVEEYLQGLVDEADPVGVPGIDLRELLDRLKTYTHNDDIHHNGETVLEHIRWVVEDVPRVLADPRTSVLDAKPVVLNFAALTHDLGKAYTYELIDGRHTFRKHADVSVEIAKVLLQDLQGSALMEQILDVVQYHDVFMKLIDAREHSNGKTKYLNKFMRTRLYQTNLSDLIAFSIADGFRAKRIEDTRNSMLGVLLDMQLVENRRQEEAEKQARRAQPPADLLEGVESLLRQETPHLIDLLPDLYAVKRALSADKRYSLLQRIAALE